MQLIRMLLESSEEAAWQKWIKEFNSDLASASKDKTIAGNKFTVKPDKGFDGDAGLSSLSFDMGGIKFNVEFIDQTAAGKPAVTIQISSPDKKGVTEKRVSGQNASGAAIVSKLNKFFDTGGKW